MNIKLLAFHESLNGTCHLAFHETLYGIEWPSTWTTLEATLYSTRIVSFI